MVTKVEYSSFSLKKLLEGYFGGSFEELVSFFTREQDMDIAEVEQLVKHAVQQIDCKKDG